MRINIGWIIAERERLEREKREREMDEGRQLPLYDIEMPPPTEKPDGETVLMA